MISPRKRIMTISVLFIKSMRGSDPDAALFYLGRAPYAETPEFLIRRIIICASEDVGMANPNALNLAVSAALAIERIECQRPGFCLLMLR